VSGVLLILVAFVVGVITAFTPCVLPVLPIILAGGGTAENRRRPYAIIAGLVTTFTLFTLAGTWIWSELHIGAKYQLRIGVAVLLVASLTLIVPKVGEWLERPFRFLTRRRAGDLGGGFLLGASLGLVFVPCAGILLGAVITNVGTHRVGVESVLVLISFALGTALPMLLVAQGSRRMTTSFRTHAQTVRVAGGILMAAAAVVIYQGWLENLQTKVPGWTLSAEHWLLRGDTAKKELARLQHRPGAHPRFATAQTTHLPALQVASARVKVPLNDYGAAPNFMGISHWLNTPGLSLDALRGKVVLIDFWTYSCINCLRTLPHLEAWDKQYGSKGLVIVGVHTPEFAFEHDLGNVTEAVKKLGVRYPVAMDNDYKTWDAYQNEFWPAEYLLDQQGHVRHIHFGEGEYDKTEQDIRLLLRAGGSSGLPRPVPERDTTPTGDITPESYLGYFRIERYSGSPLSADVERDYHFPESLPRDHFAYDGKWTVGSERIVAGDGARLRLHFHARQVNLVLGGKGLVAVIVDGRAKGAVRVNGDRLYTLVSTNRITDRTLELAFTPGVQAYAFTFG
jgi:cytochrome c biogenesis protein CcdA/thiol-disulfide isomerase/thioredoxin